MVTVDDLLAIDALGLHLLDYLQFTELTEACAAAGLGHRAQASATSPAPCGPPAEPGLRPPGKFRYSRRGRPGCRAVRQADAPCRHAQCYVEYGI